MKLKEKEFDELEEKLKKLSYTSDYIPTAEEIVSIMEKGSDGLVLPDRFVPFFMWLDMHHPDPIDAEEEMALKKIRKILYHSMEIVDEESEEE